MDASIEKDYLEHPDHFKTMDNFNRLSDGEIEYLETIKLQQRKRQERNDLLCDIDWRILRAMDNSNLEEKESMRQYRQYMHDFASNNNKYQDIILSYQQFVDLEKGKGS
jgi:hypothetical protein